MMENDNRNEILKNLQAVMLEMLLEIDRICLKYEIPYQLFAGSALGAVRHGGCIPWDDDLDIVMLRSDYNRFLKVAEAELDSKRYLLQREFSDHWPVFYSKLRKNGTAFMERYFPRDPQMHQGIYVDIFPCDNLYENRILQKLQFYAAKVVIAKALDRRGYRTDSSKKKFFMLLCKVLPMGPFKSLAQNCGQNQSAYVHTFFGAGAKFEKNVYPRKWLTESHRVPFEGKNFPVSQFSDLLLTQLYGDYMTPLPEAERVCKVHAEVVDTEHSYENYLEIQKNMKFEAYTRSIR